MPAKNTQLFIIPVLLTFSLLLTNSPQAQAKTDLAKLTAVYIFRLAENIQWANEARIQKYRLHLVDSSSEIQDQLSDIARIKKLHGKSFTVTRSNSTVLPVNAHLVYISSEKATEYPTISKQVERRNILLISDNLKDKHEVMINLLKTKNQKIKFEINKANIINQNLGIKPDIILLGGTEIDVAKLYKQSQVSLRSQKKRVNDLESQRIKLKKKIFQAQTETASLEKKQIQQSLLLNQQQDKAQIMEKLILEKERLIKTEQTRLTQIEEIATKQQVLIDDQQNAFAKTKFLTKSLEGKNYIQQQTIKYQEKLIEQEKKKYDVLTLNVKEREASLKKQAKKIKARTAVLNELDEKIAHQDAALISQSETIVNQRNFLFTVSLIAGLVIILAVAIYRSYRLKHKANAKLLQQKQLLEQAADKLAKAKKTAETANRAKSTFLANMSHELRTPLNAVLGFSRLMQDDPLSSASQQESLATINSSGTHLLQLINDILDMSKIEVGQLTLDYSDFDLGLLIRDIMDMLRGHAEEKGIQLIFDQSSNFPRFVHSDQIKLRQILINLLSNAIKFTDVGGVSLRLDSENGHLDIFSLRIEVEDSGCGISAENIERIFIPFEQMSLSALHSGTGLGLAITKQFVKLLGGSINVESTLDKGSLFRVEVNVQHILSKTDVKPVTQNQTVVSYTEGLAQYRILIAEDQLENQLLLKHILEKVGFQVQVAENGVETIALFKQWKPHFIWMDRRMPVMDGINATRAIRALPRGKKVIIAALTASVFKEQKQEILDSGCNDYVRKPYRPEEIFFCMKKHLDIEYNYIYLKENNDDFAKNPFPDKKLFNEKELFTIENDLLVSIMKAAEAAQGDEILVLLQKNQDITEVVNKEFTRLVKEFRYDTIAELCHRVIES